MKFGFPAIDDDHEHLLHLAAEVQAAVHTLAPIAVIRQRFHTLVDHSLAHFKREEQHMEQWHCPHLEAHRHEHDEIAEWMRHIQASFAADGEITQAAAPQDALDLLRAWIYKHLTTLDKPAVRFIVARVAEQEAGLPVQFSYPVENDPVDDSGVADELERVGRG